MPLVLVPSFDRLARPPRLVDLSGVVPDRLSASTTDAVGGFTVRADGRPTRLGDLFEVRGDAADGTIECVGDCSRVHFVAAGMAWGRFVVRGSVGRHCGERMVGGRFEVKGNAGDWLAAEMAGGDVHIHGSAGDNAVAALPGSDLGMRGGLVVVRGDIGARAGARMRRGILAVGRHAGEAAAFEMRAGTVVVAGVVGRHAGTGMRRGSLIALGPTAAVPPTFVRGSLWEPQVLPLLLRRLTRAGYTPAATARGPWRQWHGDSLAGGRGEIFHPEPPTAA